MKLTPDQERCVFTKNTNILVSAGAGSGKTAVLTARTINNLNDFQLDEMIILTFTKAAAFSMKEKIRKALKDKKDYKSLKKIDTAYICTFDSFSLDLVKKYSHLLNIDANINITDNVIISKLKKDIVDEVFLEFYQNQEFLNLIDTFTVKDDKSIKNDVIGILKNLDKIYDPIDYLNNYKVNNQFIDEYIELLDLKYLELKDMISLRTTCRLMNQTVSSMRNLLSYSYFVKKKYQKMQPKEKQIDIAALNKNLGAEDIQIQVESLKSINEFLKNKLFESEKIIKVYKNDIDYLKSEGKAQEEMSSRLKETLEQSREEQENIKKENILLKQQYEDLKKKYDENNKSHLNVIENLRKDNEGLKKDKTKLATAIVQMKKITEDLKKKNASKAEALLTIKNFFMNSTLVKLKDIEGFKEAETNSENTNENNKTATNTENLS